MSESAKPLPHTKYQGNPCRRGHDGVRYRHGGACVECIRLNAIERRERRKQLDTASKDAA
jgi:hypothetical protein